MRDETIRKMADFSAYDVDDLSADYEQFGIQLRRQTNKTILKKAGPWIAIGFEFQDRKGDGDCFGPREIMLGAFKSRDGEYKRYSYFIVRDKNMATKIIDLLKETFDV